MNIGWGIIIFELTFKRKSWNAVYSHFCHSTSDGLANVDETVLDESLGEDVAIEGQCMFSWRCFQFGDVMKGRGWCQGCDVRPKAPINSYSIILQSTRWIFEQNRNSSRSWVTGINRPCMNVEDELFRPFHLKINQTSINILKKNRKNF